MTTASLTLRERYQQLKAASPKLRIRNAAQQLQVSELELLELDLGEYVIRLEGDWKALLKDMHEVGYVMALTRNEFAVHERKGIYDNVSFMKDGKMGVAVNEDIDLRFLMWDWAHAYMVRLHKPKGNLHGIQFFNKKGEAIHKIYLTEKSDPKAFHNLIERYKSKDQTSLVIIEQPAVKEPEVEAEKTDIDEAAFQQEWLDLKDTHDFFPLLRKYELTRLQALNQAPENHAYQVSNNAIVQMCELAAERAVPIMIFVQNTGCIQIHTGTIGRLIPMNNWFNIMDPEFNLHLDLDGISETWVVKKPTKDGIVTGLEVFDAQGNLIVYCFGKRKPGLPELTEWRNIIDQLK